MNKINCIFHQNNYPHQETENFAEHILYFTGNLSKHTHRAAQSMHAREGRDGQRKEDLLDPGVGGRGRGGHCRGRGTLPARHYKNATSVGCRILEVKSMCQS